MAEDVRQHERAGISIPPQEESESRKISLFKMYF